jgi:T5orf172 domain-containing protein
MSLNQTIEILFISYSDFSKELSQNNPEVAVSAIKRDPLCVHICQLQKSRCSQTLRSEIITKIKEGLKQRILDTNTLSTLAKLSLCEEHSRQNNHEHLSRQWQMEHALSKGISLNDTEKNPDIPNTEPLNNFGNNSTERVDAEIQSESTIQLLLPENHEENQLPANLPRPGKKRKRSSLKAKRNSLTPAKADAALKSELTQPLFSDAFVYVASGKPRQHESNARVPTTSDPTLSTPSTPSERTRGSPSREVSSESIQPLQNEARVESNDTTVANESGASRSTRRSPSTTNRMTPLPNEDLTVGARSSQNADNDMPVLFKVGISNDVSKRLDQIQRCCETDLSIVRWSGRLKAWEAMRVEKFIKKELACFQFDVDCVNSDTVHKEWFKLDQETILDSLNRWVKFIEQKPFNEGTGGLKEFWKDRIIGQPSDSTNINAETAKERRLRWDAALNPGWFYKLQTIYLKYQSKRHWVVFLICMPPLLDLLLLRDGHSIYKLYLTIALMIVVRNFK